MQQEEAEGGDDAVLKRAMADPEVRVRCEANTCGIMTDNVLVLFFFCLFVGDFIRPSDEANLVRHANQPWRCSWTLEEPWGS